MTLDIGPHEGKNIVLDFLDRANRQIYGLYENSAEPHHVLMLVEAINVAVFLCGEYCITPPGPVAECDIAKEALQRRGEYLSERLIRFPLREKSIDDFVSKKRRAYGPHRPVFTGLFQSSSIAFFKKFVTAFVPRSVEIGVTLARRLEAGPDIDEIWKPLLKRLSSRQVEEIRHIGQQLLQDGSALTWRALCDHLPGNGRDLEPLRVALQHYYFSLYKEEYDAVVLTGVPFATVDFHLSDGTLSFDYGALEGALRAGRLWNTIRRASAESMLTIRAGQGHRKFRHGFQHMCSVSGSSGEFRAYTSMLSQIVPPRKTAILEPYDEVCPLATGFLLSHEALGAVDECLALLADGIASRVGPVEPSLIEKPPAQIIIIEKVIVEGNMHIGDKFENINQSIIAARHGIATGVIQLNNSGKAQIADALKQVEEAIASAPKQELSDANKKEALELLNELTKQGNEPTPAVAKALGTSLWDYVKNAASVVAIVRGVWPVIESLWTN